jgi:4-amino-4-deoxy-L-arabinose transferase-like glycosyltransferase
MKSCIKLLVVLVMLVVFGCRWFGPSDLYDNDQPKTVAYTVDMVEHGRWLLPEDMLGRPATKPPMYNWIGAPAVMAGWHSEFALKLPSTLAAFITVVMTGWVAHRAAGRSICSGGAFQPLESQDSAGLPFAVSAVACICVVANQMFLKLSYTARPDMVLVAFMAGGWMAASRLFRDQSTGDGSSRGWLGGRCGGLFGLQLVLWLCVAGAALTKGLPTLLLLMYIVLGSKLIGGRWSVLWRTGVAWGLPVSLVLFGLWAYGAYLSDPGHFKNVFLGDETLERIGRGGLLGILADIWKVPAWLVARFAPWSLFAMMGIARVVMNRGGQRWMSHPVGPSVLWVVLVVIFFDFSGGKRADYLAPALPAVAVLASFWLVFEGRRLWGMGVWHAALIGFGIALFAGGYQLVGSDAAREGYGGHVLTFTQEVMGITGGERIRFEDTAYTPVQSLLGYNQVDGEEGRESDARWLVRPVKGPGAVVVSDPIWVGGKQVEVKMALYAVVPGGK